MDILVFENQEEAEDHLIFYLNYNTLVSNEIKRLYQSFLKTERVQEEQTRSKLMKEQKHYFVSELGFCEGGYYYREIPRGMNITGSLDLLVESVFSRIDRLEQIERMKVNPLFYIIGDHSEANQERNQRHPLTKMVRLDTTGDNKNYQPRFPDNVMLSSGLKPEEMAEFKRLYHLIK